MLSVRNLIMQGLLGAILLGMSSPALASVSFETLRAEGEKALGQNNYGVAERSFLAAIKVCETDKIPVTDSRWAQTYKNLAQLYEIRGQFQKAEYYIEKELRAREKALGAEDPQVIGLVGKLTRFYITHNNTSKADRLTGLLLAYGERIMRKEKDLDVHFNELNKFFASHSEYAQTVKKLKELKDSAEKIRADDHLELAASLDSIGALYKEKTKYDLAEQCYKRAIDLREKALTPGHMALGFGYEHLASLYMASGKTQLAQPLLKQSLDITSKNLDFKRPEVFARVDSLAKTYISLGQLNEAETLYKQALSLIKENCGAFHKDIGSASSSLATLYLKQSRYSEAAPLLKSALSISEGQYGPQSAQLVPLLDAYAEALEKGSKSSEAAKIRQRANSIKGNASACNTTANSSANF
jgi:tetratricopeptide (TPR) repeat protein